MAMLRTSPVLVLLAACWQLVLPRHALTPADLLAFAAVVLAGVALALIAQGLRFAIDVAARPLSGRALALRRKSWAAAFQRVRDPDAPGRPRPRAPSAVPAAA
jgi:uncharacterized membrane protein YfbV (UPF0208 family)